MSNKAELCENCGAKLEVPHRWHKLVVCGRCARELAGTGTSQTAARRPSAVLPVAILGISAAVVIVIAAFVSQIHSRRMAAAMAAAAVPTRNDALPHPQLSERPMPLMPILDLPLNRPSNVSPTGATSQSADAQSTPQSNGATITGSVWLVRDRGGAAQPQRGLRVQLMRPTVRRAAIASVLTSEGQSWQQWADTYTDLATTADDAAAAGDGNGGAAAGTSPRTAAAYRDIAAAASLGATRAQAAIRSVPPEMDTLAALRLSSDVAQFNLPEFDDAVADATLLEVRTDSSGNFELPNIPAGNYYLHATVSGGSTFVEWCVPVHIDSQSDAPTVALTNANAAVIHAGP